LAGFRPKPEQNIGTALLEAEKKHALTSGSKYEVICEVIAAFQ